MCIPEIESKYPLETSILFAEETPIVFINTNSLLILIISFTLNEEIPEETDKIVVVAVEIGPDKVICNDFLLRADCTIPSILIKTLGSGFEYVSE